MEEEIGRNLMCLRNWKVPELFVSQSDSEANEDVIEESDSEPEGIF